MKRIIYLSVLLSFVFASLTVVSTVGLDAGLFNSLAAQTIREPDPDSVRLNSVRMKLNELVATDNTYEQAVDMTVGKMSLADMLRNVAKVAKVNLTIKGADNMMITTNFSRITVRDLIFFLCKEYGLDIDVTGNIVSLRPATPPPTKPKIPNITFYITSKSLSYDLGGDKLGDVTRKITSLTGENFLVPPTYASKQVSGYAETMPLEKALQLLASMNGFAITRNAQGVWEVGAETPPDNGGASGAAGGGAGGAQGPGGRGGVGLGAAGMGAGMAGKGYNQIPGLSIDSLGLITARLERGNVREIITTICEQRKLNYFFISSVDLQTSIFVRDVTFETLLAVMFAGTPYSYYMSNGIYIFGSASGATGTGAAGGQSGPEGGGGPSSGARRPGGASGGAPGTGDTGGGTQGPSWSGSGGTGSFFTAKAIPLNNRSVSKVDELIPDQLKQGLQIKPLPDLNSIIVCGDQRQVARLEDFLNGIDKSIKLVTIEVIIVDATKSFSQEVGLNMGIGQSPAPKTSGTLSPGINMSFNANSVNNIIGSMNGFGSVNLGHVGPDFYLSLKALEDNGNLVVRSTPKLSTLNGHEAELKSGETQYYKEIQNTFMGTQNPMQTESYTWKSVEANMSVKITPFISTDNSITLDIEIEETEFLARIEQDAPPGTATRNFKSQIRVEDGEMVLLGGIDRNTSQRNTSGLPYIARVPILRWIFGSTTNSKEDHKLNVFIKPTLLNP